MIFYKSFLTRNQLLKGLCITKRKHRLMLMCFIFIEWQRCNLQNKLNTSMLSFFVSSLQQTVGIFSMKTNWSGPQILLGNELDLLCYHKEDKISQSMWLMKCRHTYKQTQQFFKNSHVKCVPGGLDWWGCNKPEVELMQLLIALGKFNNNNKLKRVR